MRTLYHLGLAAFLAATVAAIIFADGYQIYIIALVVLTTMVGVGLNILLGLTGQISLGHVGFYAIGAYVSSILTVKLCWSFWIAFPLAGVVAGVAGMLLSIPALRVRGPYLAMVTIAFGFVVEQGAAEWKELTGGWNGMMNIPMPEAFGYTFVERDITLLAAAVAVLAVLLFARLTASPWGMAMRAVRDSEVAGQSLGLNPVSIRVAAFTLSAVVTGLAGSIFAAITNFISPESFPFFQSILFLLVVLIGGAETVLGPVIGAIIVVLLPEFLSVLAEYRLLFVGGLLLMVLLVAPGGIVGSIKRWLAKPDERKARAGAHDIRAFLAEGSTGETLTIENLEISFGGVHAVAGVSLAARAGEVTSIIGPNGAGKTTLLNLIGGFYKPDAGAVRLGERDLAGLPSHALARAGIGRTYQTAQLFSRMSVLENLLIALRRGRLDSIFSALFRPLRDQPMREMAESLLAFVGYDGQIHQPAGALPHVDKRLVEIARALATRSSVLLLDEPAAGLGHTDTERVAGLLRQIVEAGIAVVLVEHNMNLVMSVSDRVVVLDAGVRISEGTPGEIRNDPAVRKAYLGEGTIEGTGRAPGWQGSDETVLSVDRLSTGYGAAPVLTDIELNVRSGELVAVLGANGAGKSTMMRALSGLHRPVDGAVMLLGKDITTFAAHDIVGAGLVLVPEGRQVFPELSVVDNILLGGFARTDFDGDAEVERMLTRFPALRERRKNRAGLLSGGEQQMLAIARGLVAGPKVLMLDEPSLGLAPVLINNLYAVLAELRDEGMTILLVDQMAALALSVADRGYVIESGRVVHEGSAEEIRNEPALERAYFGDFD